MEKGKHPLSLSDFRKWIEGEDAVFKNIEGKRVSSALSPKKLLQVAESDQGDLYESVRQFYRSGGTVISQDGDYVLIDAGVGTFYTSRKSVR